MSFTYILLFSFLSFCFPTIYTTSDDFIQGESTQYILPDPLIHFHSDDYSSWTPPIQTHSRVVDLINGEFFDEHLRDTPDHMRPPAIVAFYNSFDSECMAKYEQLDFEDVVQFELPSRSFLFATRYDMGAAPKRTWYKFIPERDLAKRMNVIKCPSLVFVPSECDGFTEWCVNDVKDGISYLGCDNYIDQCKGKYTIWTLEDHIKKEHSKDGKDHTTDKHDEYKNWIENLLDLNGYPAVGGPKLQGPNKSNFTTMKEQEKWLLTRDESTQREGYRMNWIAASLPAFTEYGYKAHKMSDSHLNEFIEFYKKFRNQRRSENWNSAGQTAVNGHLVEPSIVSLDLDMEFRDRIVNRYVKPALEEWVGFPLKLTSHYGIREYYSGAWLKNHVDRIDVLIISATQSLGHFACNVTEDGFCDFNDNIDFVQGWGDTVWPIEGVDWHGNNIRYDHPPGTMIMYESAKFIHGRPYPLPQHPNHPKTKYVHLGAFSHFTPADGSWKRIGHDTNARKNINRHTKGAHYKSNPPYYPKPPKHYYDHKTEL